jgi:hypothetical protein
VPLRHRSWQVTQRFAGVFGKLCLFFFRTQLQGMLRKIADEEGPKRDAALTMLDRLDAAR